MERLSSVFSGWRLATKYLLRLSGIFILISILIPSSLAIAQQELLVLSNSVGFEFGKNITFIADFDPSLDIEEIRLFLSSQNDNNSKNFPLTITENNKISFNYDPGVYGDIRAFEYIDYYYSAIFKDGSTVQSIVFNFQYIDNRFEWNKLLDQEPFSIFWHEGDIAFANEIFETANISISHLDQFITLPSIEEPLTIITYANSSDLQEALSLSGQSWLAGHANPQMGLAMISIQPSTDQHFEIERQVPHEIAHLRIYQATQDSYLSLPIWFNEGIASLAELLPNSDYPTILNTAYKNNQIIPMVNLCESFPSNSTKIALAYAQSDSFLRYIHQEFGKEGLNRLLQAYTDGESCLNGVISALGYTLPQLDSFWQQTAFQEPRDEILIDNFMPFLFILMIVSAALVIIILATIFNQRKNINSDKNYHIEKKGT